MFSTELLGKTSIQSSNFTLEVLQKSWYWSWLVIYLHQIPNKNIPRGSKKLQCYNYRKTFSTTIVNCALLFSRFPFYLYHSLALYCLLLISGSFSLFNTGLGFQEEALFLFFFEQLLTFINAGNSRITEFHAHNYYTKKILLTQVANEEEKDE